MPDSFEYQLKLNAGPFVDAAKSAEKADKDLTAAIKQGAQEASAALKQQTASLQETAVAARSAAQTSSSGGGFSALRLEMQQLKQEVPAAARAMADIRQGAEPAGAAAEKAAGGFAKMGADIGSLKALGKGMALGALAEGVGTLSDKLKETHPVAAKAVSALSNIGSAAAAGGMAAGPWGAVIAGGLTAIAEGYKAATDNSAELAAQEEATRLATESLNAALERKAQRLADAAAAGEAAGKALVQQTWGMHEALRKMNDDLAMTRQLRDSLRDVAKIKAGGIEGEAGVEARRKLDKEAVKTSFDDKEQDLSNDAETKQAEAVRISKRREELAAKIKTLKPGEDEKRTEYQREIDASTEQQNQRTEEAATARERLERFRKARPGLESAEMGVVDAGADQAAKRERDKAETEAARRHEAVRKQQLADPNHPDNKAEALRQQTGKMKEEAERRGVDTTKNGWALKLRDSIVNRPGPAGGDEGDDDDEDGGTPRSGRGRSAGRIRGVIAPGSYQRDRSGRKVDMGLRASRELQDPRIAARGRPSAGEQQLTPGEKAIVKALGDLYREARKQNSPKK